MVRVFLSRLGQPRSERAQPHRFAVTLAIIAAVLAGAAGAVPPTASAAPDSLGTDFWLTFPGNFFGGSQLELSLFITGPVATTGTVTIPGLAFTSPFAVTPGTVTTVSLPTNAEITSSDVVETLGIHVTAQAEVTVYGLSRIPFTTDAYLGLPVDILGMEYFVQGYKNANGGVGTEFAVVGTQNGTTVTITPSVTTGPHTAGVPYTVSLDQGQTYQLRNASTSLADLSGTLVLANKPIAVFGGHQCANIPNAQTGFCDYVVEQMPPTSTWGKSFVTVPLATRIGGDTFRYLASTDSTGVKVNGVTVATLNRGELFEHILTAASVITSDKPILVTQYSNGSQFDGVTSDPFEVVVPPAEQFLSSYTVTTPATGFRLNFINVAAPTASVGSVILDGAPVGAGSFTPIPGSTFSAAQLSVGLGSHTLSGSQPFGIIVYGFDTDDSYGYPGGLSLSPVATVTSLTLAPKTAVNSINTEHCVIATVKDQNGIVVVGVRVDFTVTGVNPTSGNVNTTSDGTAPFCYTGTIAGEDSILAAVGTVSDTASKSWTSEAGPLRPVRRPTQITAGPDLCGTGQASINFTGSAGSSGDTWIAVSDAATFGSVSLSADVLIKRFDNAKGAGLLALFNEAAGKKGLALIAVNNGNTDSLQLVTIDQLGKRAVLKSVALGSGIQQCVWYRVTMAVVVSGTHVTVTGQVFQHATPTDPDTLVTAQVGPTLSFTGLRPAGVDVTGKVGVVAAATSAVVDSSVTNFLAQPQ